ncbi:MAG TPA: SDR family NAD(P)-dependent oxidoreductase [Longimicrobium sp.]|jgi:NAD(P)-dependent dehydrogenase (short-subunit alcohol dehydrogenase family)|uniref:SDR family NAD(P)-dependent oxidoreductase n=1 Tax=Longimicrobium sp. TaxID=2029185 RepID=UPI002ED7BEB9
MASMQGTVAVVTGATRGAGLAIARVLGERGATVYVTGRSTRGAATTDGMPGTVQDAADAVTAAGGTGVGVRCDHTMQADVEALFARVRREQGGMDLLVNNAWGGYEGAPGLPMKPFWELASAWDGMMVAGVRAALDSSRFAAPLLVERGRGLIVNTIAWAEGEYLRHLYYDLAKFSLARMAYGMAWDLKPHGVAAVALAPGWMRTERVMAAHAANPFDLASTESPEYLGRAVAALATDAQVMRWSGRVLTAGALAREYGFTDVDGRQPEPFRMPAGV